MMESRFTGGRFVTESTTITTGVHHASSPPTFIMKISGIATSLILFAFLLGPLTSLAFAQAQQGPYSAKVWFDTNGVPQVSYANWTQNTTGDYRFQEIVYHAGFTYRYWLDDLSNGMNNVSDDFTQSSPTCASGQLYQHLIAGHRYELRVDIDLGSPPATEVPLAKVVIEYVCQGQ